MIVLIVLILYFNVFDFTQCRYFTVYISFCLFTNFLYSSRVHKIGKCPDGWITNRNGYCYLYNEADTWQNAQSFCEDNGANLVSIRSKLEEDFLWNLVRKISYNLDIFVLSF